MGKKISPGLIVSFANQKGGVGKSTLTTLLADYLHVEGKSTGLRIGVVDCDDLQNSISRQRERELQESNEESDVPFYKVMSIPSQDFAANVEMLQTAFDIILVDLPGNMKQPGVMSIYYLIDVVFIPAEASAYDLDSTNLFFDFYKEIQAERKKVDLETSIYVILNRVNENVIEFKSIYENRDKLPFPVLDNYVKDSRVKYQRNVSTMKTKVDLAINRVCDELLDKIINHRNK